MISRAVANPVLFKEHSLLSALIFAMMRSLSVGMQSKSIVQDMMKPGFYTVFFRMMFLSLIYDAGSKETSWGF